MADVPGIINWIIKLEDSKRNPGACRDLGDGAGLTRIGITSRWHSADVPASFFTTMPNDDAYEIARSFYNTKYSMPLHLSAINSDQVAAPLMSFAVNDNIKIAVETLQTVLGVTADGSLGPLTLGELNSKDPDIIARLFRAEWYDFYYHAAQVNPNDEKFIDGWKARTRIVYP